MLQPEPLNCNHHCTQLYSLVLTPTYILIKNYRSHETKHFDYVKVINYKLQCKVMFKKVEQSNIVINFRLIEQ